MSTAIVKTEPAAVQQAQEKHHLVNFKDLRAIKDAIAKDADDAELMRYANVCNELQLNPFIQEIYFMKMKGRLSFYPSAKGFAKKVCRHPNVLGMNYHAVFEGDEFKADLANGKVSHIQSLKKSGDLIGAWCRIEFKDGRTPVVVFEKMSGHEHKLNEKRWDKFKNKEVDVDNAWSKYAIRMIEHKAVRAAAQQVVNFDEIYSVAKEYDLLYDNDADIIDAEAVEVEPETKTVESTSNRNKLVARIHVLKKEAGFSDKEYKDFLMDKVGKDSCSKMLEDEIMTAGKALKEFVDMMKAEPVKAEPVQEAIPVEIDETMKWGEEDGF